MLVVCVLWHLASRVDAFVARLLLLRLLLLLVLIWLLSSCLIAFVLSLCLVDFVCFHAFSW